MKSESEKAPKPEDIIKRRTFFSFGAFALLSATAFWGWKWLGKQDEEEGVLAPLRKMLNINEKVNDLFFGNAHLAKEYPKSIAVKQPRVNGDLGMNKELDISAWNLAINPHDENDNTPALLLSLKDIAALPKKEFAFDFKCIEGWSQISFWGGVKFSDFLAHFKLGTRSGNAPDPEHPEDLYKYVGLMTPDRGYYVGVDMKSMMHPQTLLATELNGEPLPVNHGFPLRLIIPVKYGVKNLKQIGYIYFSDTRPKDYWFERGYEYDAAL